MKSWGNNNLGVVVLGALLFVNSILGNMLLDRIIALLILLFCIMRGLKEKYWVNPYFLFALVPFSLSIYFNVADIYMLDLTHRTWFLANINMIAFLLALTLTSDVHTKKYCISVKQENLVILSILFYVIAYLGNYIEPLASILWLFSVPSIVCALKTKKKIMYVLVFVSIVLPLLSGASKMAVLLQLLTIMACMEKYFNIIKKYRKLMPVIAALAVVFMIFSFSFANKGRGNYDAKEGMGYYESQGVTWNSEASLFLPYMYFVHAWGNLQYVTETQDTRTNGLWMLKPILGYIQLDDNFKTEYNLKPYSSFNTFTFITCGFKDFGYWLSVIMSFFLGFYVKKIYSKYKLSRSPFDVATYVCVALATAEMFFSNHFFMQSYPFTILILMTIVQLVCPKYIECEK